MTRAVVVTGVGIASSLGEGLDVHLQALRAGSAPSLDTERFAPFPVHPLVPIDWDRQIPKKSDQRQMETWQRLGVYAAGLALDGAGIKDDPALKSRTHIIVGSGGGERDYAVDGQILTGLRTAADPGAFLNERLMSDLRPTLFLAQLSNLLAGNIAIVHSVTGASRTFMGEEACGVDALRIAEARIAAGQADIMLVGGSYNAERPDTLLVFALGGYLWAGDYRPVGDRHALGAGGFVPGSGAAFLVVESADHASTRGAPALARLHPVGSTRSHRLPGTIEASLRHLVDTTGADAADTILSGDTGVAVPSVEEGRALDRLMPHARRIRIGDHLGHLLEAVAPAGVALAAGLIAAGAAHDVAVSIVGHHRGEGLVRLTAPG